MNEATLIQSIRRYLGTLPECFFGKNTVDNMVLPGSQTSSYASRGGSSGWRQKSEKSADKAAGGDNRQKFDKLEERLP